MRNNVSDVKSKYGIDNWGAGYFKVNRRGNILVDVNADDSGAFDIMEVVGELQKMNVQFPVVMRFPQILETQLRKLNERFQSAIDEFKYQNRYMGVFPVKVNHRKEVVDEVLRAGRKYHMGLEVGSKPELFIALGTITNKDTLIVCNGYKDDTYLRLCLYGMKLGRNLFCVLESLNELKRVLKLSKSLKIKPRLGVRVMLYSRGSGRWEKSGGPYSKFGVTTQDLLSIIEILKKENLLDCLQMLHFHIGSQITEIKRIKNAIKEGARVYAKARQLVPSLTCINVGGGLGVDYDGSRSSSDSSTNYSMQEYANDVVYTIMDVCENEEIPHPVIVSESGRAITAYHSVLIMKVFREMTNTGGSGKVHVTDSDPQVVVELSDIAKGINAKNYREYYHDALEHREELFSMFDLGYLSLDDRARGEELFWEVCRKTLKYAETHRSMPEEFERLRRQLSSRFICNFSVFQSVPDAWALEQLFPIVPLHRLNEEPKVNGILADVTCDSDGIIDNFIDIRTRKEFLELHSIGNAPYFIGVFIIGAYQDIMGDLHNLFGKVNEVHVVVDEEDNYAFHRIIQGDGVMDVLEYVRFDNETLTAQFYAKVSEEIAAGNITRQAARKIFEEWNKGMEGYTYLDF